MKRASLSIILLTVAAIAQAAPLPVRDLNPLLSGYELPPALPSTGFDSLLLNASLAIGNTSLNQHSAQDHLQLDAELQRWQLSLAKPLSETLSLRVELPYLSVSGGQLDSFIEGFHHTFGLPNGNRGNWPSERLWVQHEHLGNIDYQLDHASRGIGDLTLRVGRTLGMHPTLNNMLWLSVKLPTGNAHTLTGSGSVDVALGLSASQQLSASFTSQQQLSVSFLGHGTRLQDQQQTLVWSGSLGLDAAFTSHWLVAVQLDGHSKVFDTGLRGLGNALQLSFGPRYQAGAWQTSLLLSEDLAVDTAPDAQFQLDVARKF